MLLTDLAQDGLTVLPFHCLLKDSESFDEAKFLSDCEPYFQVISRETMPQCIADEMERYLDALYRQGKKAFGFYSGGESWTLLILKEIAVMDELLPEKSASFRALDGSILHSLILERLLGLKNDAAQSKTDYTTSMEKAVSSVQSGFSKCAFLLNPARLKEICEVADAGEKMPPKSTCFYPAIPAGMVINLSKDES